MSELFDRERESPRQRAGGNGGDYLSSKRPQLETLLSALVGDVDGLNRDSSKQQEMEMMLGGLVADMMHNKVDDPAMYVLARAAAPAVPDDAARLAELQERIDAIAAERDAASRKSTSRADTRCAPPGCWQTS